MVFNEFEWCRAVIIKIHDRLVQYISLECRTAPRIWRLRGIPELTCAPPVLDRPAAVAGPGGGRGRAVATAADRIAAQLGYEMTSDSSFRAHDPSRDRRRSQCPRSSHGARRSMAFQHSPLGGGNGSRNRGGSILSRIACHIWTRGDNGNRSSSSIARRNSFASARSSSFDS